MTTDNEKGCDLSEFFDKVGEFWVFRAKDGRTLPVLFCPFCGERIPYGELKENKE